MLSPKRQERQPRACLLPGVLLCIIFAAVSAMPAKGRCPGHIDCARQGRHFCKSGSSHCGPCLTPLDENEDGKCVMRKRPHHREKVTAFPSLDEEIDFLHAVIAKQQVSNSKAGSNSPPPPPTVQTDAPVPGQRSQPTTTTTGPLPGSTTPQPATGLEGRRGPIVTPSNSRDGLLVIMIGLCVLVGTVALIMAAVCWVRMQKETRLAKNVDYAARGGITPASGRPNGTSAGDQTLAQNAQMYHYQHQKQQMISMGKHKIEQKVPESEVTSDEEEIGGDFTVYECPGLAPRGEMEVKNPLFDDTTLYYQGDQNHQ